MGYINGIMKGGLAQLVERWNHNPQVEGSSPPAATTLIIMPVQKTGFFYAQIQDIPTQKYFFKAFHRLLH